ncbi:hypothetical protein Mtc_0798 [Methanocella conradii HZ254]|uniref:Uncharacterized protein n=1 Tax=Methanocella conradii (strain DSM 24694 / JCM 17849 / CGMCC 1.5162 / HZ254) TaxID=1041930 RepID=H8I9E1_METCZ|nr:hypothetical protein [Methanocella conradii]AFC99559.1 hypothetical protein Mtc_0798 [Methanocella conradii HZ254]MDI6897405.1 hypothetical protein [Methanocella conradii]
MKVLVILALGLTLILAVTGAASPGTGTLATGDKGIKNIDEAYHVVKVTGIRNESCTFDIMSVAVKGKDGKVAIMSFSKPISAEYFFSTGKVALSMKEKAPGAYPKPVIVNYENATVNVAGASAVLAIKSLAVLRHDRNETDVQFSGLSAYLPDGKVKSYTFTPPVKLAHTKANMTATISGNPAFTEGLKEALKGGGTFPANAPAVPLKKIDA